MGHISGFGAIIDTADTCVLRPAHMQFQSLVATTIAVPVLRACSRRWGARRPLDSEVETDLPVLYM